MTFKIIYWNIWLENQIRGVSRIEMLLEELESIITGYNPDCVGLNEVVKHTEEDIPQVSTLLESFGYKYHYFSHGSGISDNWDIGSGIFSKLPIKDLSDIELGRNATAEKKGQFNSPVKAVTCRVGFDEQEIGVIVAHPINLKPSTLKDHFVHTKNLANYIATGDFKTNTIIGGDFNEPMHFPKSFKRRTAKILNHRTGTKTNPTWRHNTWLKTPLRANLDRLFWTKEGNLELTDFKIIESHVSDHRPMYAEFIIRDEK